MAIRHESPYRPLARITIWTPPAGIGLVIPLIRSIQSNPFPTSQTGIGPPALYHLELMYAVDRFTEAAARCKTRGCRGRRRARMAERPRLDRARNCRTVGRQHVNDGSGLRQIPRDGRARRRRRSLYSARAGSSNGDKPTCIQA